MGWTEGDHNGFDGVHSDITMSCTGSTSKRYSRLFGRQTMNQYLVLYQSLLWVARVYGGFQMMASMGCTSTYPCLGPVSPTNDTHVGLTKKL